MRVIFMGTSGFAVPSLEALVKAGHTVSLVVTQPDRPSGRGRQMHVSPVKELAQSLELPIFQPEKIRTPESIEVIRGYAPVDAIIVASFGQIIPKAILEIPEYGSINVHASLLPKYRGAAPIQYSVMNGDEVTGITTMMMDVGLDTGDILLQEMTPIGINEAAGELEARLAAIGADLLIRTLEGLSKREIKRVPQDNELATLAPSIKREQGKIDWNRPAREIVNLTRALTPRPGTYTTLKDEQLKIMSAEVETDEQVETSAGEIIDISKDHILVAAGTGTVKLREVQPQNRKRMNAGEFARGARLQKGTVLGI